jgi:NAD(P)-dependent dehydrogenase (short-subunit alcohol dehydrogenase family)
VAEIDNGRVAELDNTPVALVTGGANGIGAALCHRLARQGYRVVVADLDAGGSAAVAEAVGGSAVEVDVRDPDRNRAMVAAATDTYGRLDLVVLNAGVASEQGAAEPLALDLYRRVTGVNIDGVVFGIDAAVPALSAGGSIVVTSSLVGLAPEDGNPLYGLTKAAVLAYVRGLAPALAPRRIRLNAVCPGFADTAILGRVTRKFLIRQKFPLLTADDVAEAVTTVAAGDGTGEVWTVIAGRPLTRHEFPALPATLHADGRTAVLRPFLAPRPDAGS